MTQLAPNLAAFVIVPTQDSLTFGSLFEVKSEADEVFISSATVDNIEVVTTLTATKLKSQGAIVSTTQDISASQTVSSNSSLNLGTSSSSNSSSSNQSSGSSSSNSGGSGY